MLSSFSPLASKSITTSTHAHGTHQFLTNRSGTQLKDDLCTAA